MRYGGEGISSGSRHSFSRAWLRRGGMPLGPPPLLQQSLAAARIARLGDGEARDPVGAEMAGILPQFAPRYEDMHPVEETQRKRPDQALRIRTASVAIADRDFAFGADRLAHDGEIDRAGGDALARRR